MYGNDPNRERAHDRADEGSRFAAFEHELPRRDSAIVVGVTAAIVGLIVLWMTQAGAMVRTSAAEDSAVPEPIDRSDRGEPYVGGTGHGPTLMTDVAGD